MAEPVPKDVVDGHEFLFGHDLLTEAISRLSSEPIAEQQFRTTILEFMHDRVPITTTQNSLQAILNVSAPLQEKFSSFILAPLTTESECQVARAQLAQLLNIPLIQRDPDAPSEAETLAFSNNIKDRLGDEAHEEFMHTFLMRARNQEQGIATRPQLVKLLEGHDNLLRQFEAHWPPSRGDF